MGMGWDGIDFGYGIATTLKIVHWPTAFPAYDVAKKVKVVLWEHFTSNSSFPLFSHLLLGIQNLKNYPLMTKFYI